MLGQNTGRVLPWVFRASARVDTCHLHLSLLTKTGENCKNSSPNSKGAGQVEVGEVQMGCLVSPLAATGRN